MSRVDECRPLAQRERRRMLRLTRNLLAVALVVLPGFARADLGVIRVREVIGSLDVTLATSPTPLRAGTIEVNALVLDAATGAVRSPVDLTLELIPSAGQPIDPAEPGNSSPMQPLRQAAAILAGGGDPVDPVLSARLRIPSAGPWKLGARVRSGADSAHLSVALQVEEAGVGWRDIWDLLALPVVVVLAFACHQGLRRRARGSDPH